MSMRIISSLQIIKMKGKVMSLTKLATLIPLHELEQKAQQQIYNNLGFPFLEKLAIMPDCHPGYLLPIGGVALLNGVISPNYVGFDQGCGMCCVIVPCKYDEIIKNKKQGLKIFDQIYEEIPVGYKTRISNFPDYQEFKSASGNKTLNKEVNEKLRIQLGTLGSGNHFIELGKEENDKNLGITIHSGSRKPGYLIAQYYMRKSKTVDRDLPNGFLHLDSDVGQMFVQDLNYALEYALANRKMMMDILFDILGFNVKDKKALFLTMVNENHNHAIVQDDGRVLHRKGATESAKDQLGVIPGNMRDGVYIVKGLGNEAYLNSSSHGAGRKGSRTWAKEAISLDRFKETMKGKITKVCKGTLDEAPDAYKDVSVVIKAQEGVVIEVVNHIESEIIIKDFKDNRTSRKKKKHENKQK